MESAPKKKKQPGAHKKSIPVQNEEGMVKIRCPDPSWRITPEVAKELAKLFRQVYKQFGDSE